MFKKGDVVKLNNFNKTYEVLVTGYGKEPDTFAGVITKSEYDESYHKGELTVGTYAKDFEVRSFKKVG